MAVLDQLVLTVIQEVREHLESVVIQVSLVNLDWLDHKGWLACPEILEFAEVTVSLVKPAELEEQVSV